jgi:hypothetical protein
MFDAKSEGQSGRENEDSDRFVWAKKVTVAFTPAITNANINHEQDVTVPGAAVGDIVICNPPAAGVAVTCGACRVKSAGVVALSFSNTSAGNLTHAAGNFVFMLIRQGSGA